MKELRADRGFSQEDLSARSGVGRVFISHIENGHKEACLGTIEALAGSFGLTIAELMKGI